VSFLTTAGQTYYVRIGGFEGSQGSGVLTLYVDNGGIIGDINYDGTVSLSDLAVLLSNFGNPDASYGDGDLEPDGDVDLSDLAIMLSNFGASCS
jgi:hypothetical protein